MIRYVFDFHDLGMIYQPIGSFDCNTFSKDNHFKEILFTTHFCCGNIGQTSDNTTNTLFDVHTHRLVLKQVNDSDFIISTRKEKLRHSV